MNKTLWLTSFAAITRNRNPFLNLRKLLFKKFGNTIQSSKLCNACLTVSLSVWLFVCLSVCLFVCLSVCLFVCLSVCLFVCLSVCLFVCLSACLFVCLTVQCFDCSMLWLFNALTVQCFDLFNVLSVQYFDSSMLWLFNCLTLRVFTGSTVQLTSFAAIRRSTPGRVWCSLLARGPRSRGRCCPCSDLEGRTGILRKYSRQK
jgi:hypothetical protein